MGEHLSTGKYTFLRLSPFISPSLPSQSKSIIHLFKTLSFNVIFFLNVLFFNLSPSAPLCGNLAAGKMALPFRFPCAFTLLTHPPPFQLSGVVLY